MPAGGVCGKRPRAPSWRVEAGVPAYPERRIQGRHIRDARRQSLKSARITTRRTLGALTSVKPASANTWADVQLAPGDLAARLGA
ncbi:MAG TPA: hypothetical protein VGM12_21005 [Trebonia sp.]|jgi:hypothetical protein